VYTPLVVVAAHLLVKFTDGVIFHARETEPEVFVLEIFFNAHPIPGDAKQKPKATNVLVPTSIAYAGGYIDFPVDMGSDVCPSTLHPFSLAEPFSLVCISPHDSKRGFH
jgi:hypothetical protein